MLFGTLVIQALLAASALALPSVKERAADRVGLRNRKPRQPHFLNVTRVAHEDYDSNWAGGILTSSAGTYKSVTATWTLPNIKEPSGGSGWHSAASWVGIDGATCENAIWQAGFDMSVDGSSVTYDPWYEWYPEDSVYFTDVTFSQGDSVTVTVAATSKNAGTATFTNNSKGKSVTYSYSSSYTLCEQDAEWIVEDFGDTEVPFANFGTVTFASASAKTSSGSSVGPESSGYWSYDIEQNNKILTSTSLGSSSVTVKYIGS